MALTLFIPVRLETGTSDVERVDVDNTIGTDKNDVTALTARVSPRQL